MDKRVYYGGQAVFEGVMMRGRKTMVTAVRHPDGVLSVDKQLLGGICTGRLRRIPLLRGIIILIESLVLGIRSLVYSVNISLEEEKKKVSGGSLGIMLVIALAFAVVLFFLVPLFLTKLLNIGSPILFNIVDGLIRIAIFVIYIRLVALAPDIKRVFAYHGAEHKTVNAYEAGAPLDVDAIKRFSTAHVRCGTSFLFVVLVLSALIFALVGIRSSWFMALSRIILIPVIAAVSYEIIYFGGRHANNGLIRVILAPGMWLQALTTRQPDDNQLEVAAVALKRVVEDEE
jgi:uncharacterized protein YqhQ